MEIAAVECMRLWRNMADDSDASRGAWEGQHAADESAMVCMPKVAAVVCVPGDDDDSIDCTCFVMVSNRCVPEPTSAWPLHRI